jgi:hypothetical protein
LTYIYTLNSPQIVENMTIKAYLKDIKERLKDGDPQGALELCEEALDLFPSVEVWLRYISSHKHNTIMYCV